MTPTQIAISVSICVHGVVFGLVWFERAPSPTEPAALTLDIVASSQSRLPGGAKPAAHHSKSMNNSGPARAEAEPDVSTLNSDPLPAAEVPEKAVDAAPVATSNNVSNDLPNDIPSKHTDLPTPSHQQEAVVSPPSYSLGARLTPKPIYPELAQQRNQSGKVVVHAWVNEKGEPIPDKLKVISSSGYPLLDDAAIRCVLRWRFNPARLGDVAVPGDVKVTLVFDLKDAN